MTNLELIKELKQKVAAEKSMTLEVIKLLQIMDQRKYYLELGYSSLFDFAVRELGYEAGAAHRRISAARLLQEMPELEIKVEEGNLSLSNLTLANQFFRKERKANKTYSKAEKKQVLEKLEGQSYRETEKTLADLAPEYAKKDKVRQLGTAQVELKITISLELYNQLEDLKQQLSHVNPSMTQADLLKILVENMNKKPRPKASPSTPKVTKTIPIKIKRQVYKRDKGQCTYPNCKSKHLLQYDHIKPQAYGGEHTVENLRLLCFSHHKLVTEKVFGRRN